MRNKKSHLSKSDAVIILLTLLSFSITFLSSFREYSVYGTGQWADALLYQKDGLDFARGDFFPNNTRHGFMIVGPVMPLIVAFSKIVFGDSVIPVLVFNSILAALGVIILYKLGQKLISRSAGIILALWATLNLNFIRMSAQTGKEPLLIFSLPLLTLVIVRLFQSEKQLFNAIFSALLYSFIIHTDERFIVYGPLIIALIFIQIKRYKWKISLLWLATLLVSMLPWTIRNYNQFDQVVILTPRTTVFTSKLWGEKYAEPHFSSVESKEENFDLYAVASMNRGIDMSSAPKYEGHQLYLMAFYHYWKPTYFATTYIQYGTRALRWSLIHNLVSILFYGLFLPFYFIGGLLSVLERNMKHFVLWLIPLLHSILHTYMIWPLERYRLPFDFLIVLTAIWVVSRILLNMRNQRLAVRSLICDNNHEGANDNQ